MRTTKTLYLPAGANDNLGPTTLDGDGSYLISGWDIEGGSLHPATSVALVGSFKVDVDVRCPAKDGGVAQSHHVGDVPVEVYRHHRMWGEHRWDSVTLPRRTKAHAVRVSSAVVAVVVLVVVVRVALCQSVSRAVRWASTAAAVIDGDVVAHVVSSYFFLCVPSGPV